MALAADDLAAIRSHIGETAPPSDGDLGPMWDRLGSVETVALAVLRARHADMLAQPSALGVSGDYDENWSENLTALERKIAHLEAAVAVAAGTGGVVTVAHLTRSGRSR